MAAPVFNGNLVAAGKPFFDVTWYGAKGDGVTDSTTAIQNAINAANANGGGVVYFPPGTYIVSSSLQLVGMSDILLTGPMIGGWQATIKCTSALNGSDSVLKNSLINANNLNAVQPYPHNVVVANLYLDCTNQNASGVPGGANSGYNLAGIEFQNVDYARAMNVYIKKAFGNGIIWGSINPSMPYALQGALGVDCVLDTCVNGILPQYTIAGSVLTGGALNGGFFARNTILNPGGPALDFFNCTGTEFGPHYISGMNTTAVAAGQTVGSFHSDFGLLRCKIYGLTFEQSGGIYCLGHMIADSETGNVKTPGPIGCSFADITINGTALMQVSAPAIPSSGVAIQNTSGFAIAVNLSSLGTGLTVATSPDNVTYTNQTLTGVNASHFTIKQGGWVKLTYTGAPSGWTWYAAPNCQVGAVTMLAGTTATDLGQVAKNTFTNIKIFSPPYDAYTLYDATANQIYGGYVENPGEWLAGRVISAFGTPGGAAGIGCNGNEFSNMHILDNRSPKQIISNYKDDSNAGTSEPNRWLSCRLEKSASGVIAEITSPNGSTAVFRGNVGPGQLPTAISPNPSMPTTGTALTNTGYQDWTLYVTALNGATISAVNINGVTVNTAGPWPVRVGDAWTPTYTGGTPTLSAVGAS